MHIVFFDIDGTLAEGTRVPESAAAAVARVREAGDLVFICTGRPPEYARKNFGQYADGFVCCNGRLAVRGGERVVDQSIAPDTLQKILEILDRHDLGYAFFGEEGIFYGGNPAHREMAEQVQGGRASTPLAEALERGESLYSYDIYFSDPAQRDAAARDLVGISLVNPHGPHPSADVTVEGYGKGDAVRDVTAALGIAHEDSYAFGDGINDLSMIAAVGHGVAMGNAVPEVKAAAEFVTTDIDKDGVANGLAHYGLA